MAGDHRGLEVVRQQQIPLVVGLEHVDVRTAQPAGADFQDELGGAGVAGIVDRANLTLGLR